MKFAFDQLVTHLTAEAVDLATARSSRKEAPITAMIGAFLGGMPNASALHIAGSCHDRLRSKGVRVRLEKQWADKFGEHDVSLSCEGHERPVTVAEVKYARTVGGESGEQDQVVQPYCYLINDLLFAALGYCARRADDATYVSLVLVEDAIFSATKDGSVNPWQTLVGSDPYPASDQIAFVPRSAQPNSGRGSRKPWPEASPQIAPKIPRKTEC